MENFDHETAWPPIPLSKHELGSMKGVFWRHTQDYLRQFNPHANIRRILNKAQPKDQSIDWIYVAKPGTVAPVPLREFMPLEELEGLSPFEQTEVLQDIPDIRLKLQSTVRIDAKPKMQTEFGTFTSTDRFTMDDTVASDLMNTLNPKSRELIARLMTLRYIEDDEGMCHFYNQDVDASLELECTDQDDEEDYEKFAMAGDAPEDDEEFDPLPSQYYEYYVLRQRFYDMIAGKL